MKEDDLEDTGDVNPEQIESFWCIDLEWFQSNNRSFLTLARRCLCAKCRRRLGAGEDVPADEFLAAIEGCCSQEPGFITGGLPLLESIFRLLLANGNSPLGLKEISRQLSEWRVENSYPAPVEVLSRLLESDRYYGLKQVNG